jgi:hypothetical protein
LRHLPRIGSIIDPRPDPHLALAVEKHDPGSKPVKMIVVGRHAHRLAATQVMF